MTQDEFRKLALGLPEAVEASHMGHPDFRVKGKIFAGLSTPKKGTGSLGLNPEQQHELITAEPDVFFPAAGAWGRNGWTMVNLKAARRASMKTAIKDGLAAAWRNKAPASLVKALAK